MPFENKSTITYRVYPTRGFSNPYLVSARTDRKTKSGWTVSNAALKRALVEGEYLDENEAKHAEIEGKEDGVLFVKDSRDGYLLLELEYKKAHEEPESKGFFGEPRAKGVREASEENPVEGSKNVLGLSTGATVALAAAGVVVVGGIGWWLYQRSQAAAQAQAGTLPASTTPAQLPITGTTDQIPPFVPTDVSTPIDNA